ncbi:MAG TPA: hypothetical protein VFS08_13135 [Gemmatimonadaceae bacterium]|nr:hypothetical protein [Gemmatimonadaceae bacterium]
MSALAALHRTRRALGALLLARALVAGAAAVVLVLAVARVLASLGALEAARVRGAALPVAAGVVGLLVALVLVVRDGRITTTRAALWVEERVPTLAFALVTAAEPRHATLVPALAPRLGGIPWGALLRGAAVRALLPPAVALGAALVALLAAPPLDMAAGGASRAEGAGGRGAAARTPTSGALGRITATVRPPAYSGLPTQSLDDPTTVAALVGSRVTLSGRGEGAVRATLAETRLDVRRGDGWRVALTMPARPGAVRLADGVGDRLVILDPRLDSVPVVTLLPAVRDTVLREPVGTIALAATAHDDIGLATSGFEYIVSSGEGESFTFRSGTLGAATHGGARDAAMRASLSVTQLQLKPGDIVHVRAVARDGNTLSGPGVGASETRAIRIARAGEYDSVAVEGAPPPTPDSTALSQRMLLILTERLQQRRPRLDRATVLAESQRIARDQTRLRRQVGEIVFARLGEAGGEHEHGPGDAHDLAGGGRVDPDALLAQAAAATTVGMPEALDFHGDETPVVAINKPLLEAYNHMWDAARELELGEPGRAIPPMRRALAALQQARQAERIYLRGRPPTVIVDIGKVRLQGKEHGSDNVRQPRPAEDDAAGRRARRLDAALALLAPAPAGAADARAGAVDTSARASVAVASARASLAIDSLLLLRLDALGEDPALAAALDEAVRRLRAGEDATAALRRARRAALGATDTRPALPRWSGAP